MILESFFGLGASEQIRTFRVVMSFTMTIHIESRIGNLGYQILDLFTQTELMFSYGF